jgi:hypothetical protein
VENNSAFVTSFFRSLLGLRRSLARRRFVPMCSGCNEVMPGVYLTMKKKDPKTSG